MENDLTELCHLAIKYGTDRHPLSKHSYTPYYYNLLKDKRQSVKKVLEIGAAIYGGHKMWRDFFPNATIYGAEPSPQQNLSEDRIKVILFLTRPNIGSTVGASRTSTKSSLSETKKVKKPQLSFLLETKRPNIFNGQSGIFMIRPPETLKLL